jgi:hypothetical protein
MVCNVVFLFTVPEKTYSPVTRYTREQLIALRKSSTVLPSMKNMSDIVSLETQEPVCFTKLEPEDVSPR